MGKIVRMSDLETNKAIARQFFRHFETGDVPATIALFHPDATYWFPTTREHYTMPQLAAGLEWIKSRLDGAMTFEIGPIVAEDGKVSIQAESFAKTVEGLPFNNRYHVYFEMEDGKIRRALEYNDTAHVYATLRAGQKRDT
jgi:uncharacterized protein